MRKLFLMVFGTAVYLSCLNVSAITIKCMYLSNVDSDKTMKAIVNEYEEKYPDRKVELMPIPAVSGEDSKIILMLKDKNLGIDTARLYIETLDTLASGNVISPIPELKDWKGWKDFIPALDKKMIRNGKYYGIPCCTNSRCLYYNKNIFEKAGIPVPWQPKNWNDIYEAAKKIKEKVPGIIPFWFKLTTAQAAEMFLYGTNDRYMKDGKWVVTSQGILEVFEFVQKIIKENLSDHISKLINTQAPNFVEKEYMPKERVGIVLSGSWVINQWVDDDKKHLQDIYLRAMMPTNKGQAPGFITLSDGHFFAMTPHTEKREATLDFMKFACNKESVLKDCIYEGNLTCRTDTGEMEEYPEQLREFTKHLEYAEFNPSEPEYYAVANGFNDALNLVAVGQATPLEAMNQYATNMERELGKDKIVREYKK